MRFQVRGRTDRRRERAQASPVRWLLAYIICENDAGRKTLTESVNSLKDRGRQTLFFIRVPTDNSSRFTYGLTW
jgi:hypothetical protein